MTLHSTKATVSSANPAGESAFLTDLMRILNASPSASHTRWGAKSPSQRTEREGHQAETQHLVAHMRSLAEEIEAGLRLSDA